MESAWFESTQSSLVCPSNSTSLVGGSMLVVDSLCFSVGSGSSLTSGQSPTSHCSSCSAADTFCIICFNGSASFLSSLGAISLSWDSSRYSPVSLFNGRWWGRYSRISLDLWSYTCSFDELCLPSVSSDPAGSTSSFSGTLGGSNAGWSRAMGVATSWEGCDVTVVSLSQLSLLSCT